MALHGVVSTDTGNKEYVKELEDTVTKLEQDVKELKAQISTLGRR